MIRNLKAYLADPEVEGKVANVDPDAFQKWDEPGPNDGDRWLEWLESVGVFFSAPLDLDFMLLEHFPDSYPRGPEVNVSDTTTKKPSDPEETSASLRKQVLGKKGIDPTATYTTGQLQLFERYHSLFQLGSKPSSHLVALANLDDTALLSGLPPVMTRLVERAVMLLTTNPE